MTQKVCIPRYSVTYCTSIECWPNFTIGKLIGRGQAADVYEAFMKNGTTIGAVKIQPIDTPIVTEDETEDDEFRIVSESDFIKEAEITMLMGKAKISPKTFKIVVCSDSTREDKKGNETPIKIGLLFMEHGGMSLEDYKIKHRAEFKRNQKEIGKQVWELAKGMARHGYIHNDLGSNNVMVKIKRRRVRTGRSGHLIPASTIVTVKIIDFGAMRKLNWIPSLAEDVDIAAKKSLKHLKSYIPR